MLWANEFFWVTSLWLNWTPSSTKTMDTNQCISKANNRFDRCFHRVCSQSVQLKRLFLSFHFFCSFCYWFSVAFESSVRCKFEWYWDILPFILRTSISRRRQKSESDFSVFLLYFFIARCAPCNFFCCCVFPSILEQNDLFNSSRFLISSFDPNSICRNAMNAKQLHYSVVFGRFISFDDHVRLLLKQKMFNFIRHTG